jgi:hypothetical protein
VKCECSTDCGYFKQRACADEQLSLDGCQTLWGRYIKFRRRCATPCAYASTTCETCAANRYESQCTFPYSFVFVSFCRCCCFVCYTKSPTLYANRYGAQCLPCPRGINPDTGLDEVCSGHDSHIHIHVHAHSYTLIHTHTYTGTVLSVFPARMASIPTPV